MEKKKIKKQKNNNSKTYVSVFILIILIVVIISAILINKFKEEGAKYSLVSTLELNMLEKYVNKVDFDMLYQYTTLDSNARVDYALKKYLSANKDITEFYPEKFIEYYENIFGESDIGVVDLRQDYITLLAANGINCNLAENTYSVDYINITNTSDPRYHTKRIIEKATRNGNVYTIYSKNIVTENEALLDQITLENYKELSVSAFDEKLTINLDDTEKMIIVDFTKKDIR